MVFGQLVMPVQCCAEAPAAASSFRRIKFMKITKFDLKWVHNMARYQLILRLDGALWLTIISEAPLTPKGVMEGPKIPKESKMALRIRGALRLLSPPEYSILGF